MATTHVEPIALNLLKAGAVMSAQNNSVWTALMYAVQNGHEQVALHVLLEAKADPNKANSD
jgi:ankyrin repeat protein